MSTFLQKSIFFNPPISLIIFLSIVNSICLRAQENGYKWKIIAGVLLSENAIIDKNFSLVPFSGQIPGAGISVIYSGKKSLQELKLHFLSGKLNAGNTKNTSKESYLTIKYSYLFGLTQHNSGFKIFIGPSLNAGFAGRTFSGFLNNNISYENFISLSGDFHFGYDFGGALSGFYLANEFSLPAFSSVEQPSFGSQLSIGEVKYDSKLRSFILNRIFLSPAKFLNLKNAISLGRRFGENNQMSISYVMEYYNLKTNRKVIQSWNGLELSYGYRF